MKNRKALLVIDMQDDYIGEGCRFHGYPDLLVEQVNDRIATADRDGIPVIYVRNIGRRNRQPYISDFTKGLIVVSDLWIDKDRASAFSNPALMKLLEGRGISDLEMIGIDGNFCVAATALDAGGLGFSVTLPLSYIGIKDRRRFLQTKEKLLKFNIKVTE